MILSLLISQTYPPHTHTHARTRTKLYILLWKSNRYHLLLQDNRSEKEVRGQRTENMGVLLIGKTALLDCSKSYSNFHQNISFPITSKRENTNNKFCHSLSIVREKMPRPQSQTNFGSHSCPDTHQLYKMWARHLASQYLSPLNCKLCIPTPAGSFCDDKGNSIHKMPAPIL